MRTIFEAIVAVGRVGGLVLAIYWTGFGLFALLRVTEPRERYQGISLGFIGLGLALSSLEHLVPAGHGMAVGICLWGGAISMWVGLIRVFRLSRKFPQGYDEGECFTA